jgi:hypothetical protein
MVPVFDLQITKFVLYDVKILSTGIFKKKFKGFFSINGPIASLFIPNSPSWFDPKEYTLLLFVKNNVCVPPELISLMSKLSNCVISFGDMI